MFQVTRIIKVNFSKVNRTKYGFIIDLIFEGRKEKLFWAIQASKLYPRTHIYFTEIKSLFAEVSGMLWQH